MMASREAMPRYAMRPSGAMPRVTAECDSDAATSHLPAMTASAPTSNDLTASPGPLMPPSAMMVGAFNVSAILRRASTHALIAVTMPTPAPVTMVVVQMEPLPMPTFTASAPASASRRYPPPSMSATLPAMMVVSHPSSDNRRTRRVCSMTAAQSP